MCFPGGGGVRGIFSVILLCELKKSWPLDPRHGSYNDSKKALPWSILVYYMHDVGVGKHREVICQVWITRNIEWSYNSIETALKFWMHTKLSCHLFKILNQQ